MTDGGGFWIGLLKAELLLTANVVFGLVVGELILSASIVERFFRPVLSRLAASGFHPKIAGALVLALGSPRSGAALLSASYSGGEITREEATFGTLSLAFPGYLRRWVVTSSLAWSLAGAAGFIFAAILLARSAVRFCWSLFLLKRSSPVRDASEFERHADAVPAAVRRKRILRTLLVSMPWAWGFFAATYAVMPWIEDFFAGSAPGFGAVTGLPPAGWAIAVSALAHVTASFAAAGGALAAGEIGVAQAVLALLVGNFVGTITRVLRQNVGYWMGIFPRELMPLLIKWHMATLVTVEVISIACAWAVVMGSGS